MRESDTTGVVEHTTASRSGALIRPGEHDSIAVLPWAESLPGPFQRLVVRAGPMQGNTALLGAGDDVEAVGLWLRGVSGQSESTYRAYRREAERLLLWASIERGKSLSELNRGDCADYLDFLRDPQPAARWVGAQRHPRHSEHWRPFVGALTPDSARYAQNVLHGMFRWLADQQWLQINPMPGARTRRTTSTRNPPKSLTPAQCRWVMGAIEAMPRTTPVEQAYYERMRWMFVFFRGMAARAHEAAQAPMSSFQSEATGRGTVLSWRVYGKGRVPGLDEADSVPVRPVVKQALARFRVYFGLSPYPLHDEATPVIPSLASMKRHGGIDLTRAWPLTESAIYKVFDGLFAKAAALAQADGALQDSDMLRQRSTHSLRHTAIREFVDETSDLALAQRFARHDQIATTMLYASPHYDQLSDTLAAIDTREQIE